MYLPMWSLLTIKELNKKGITTRHKMPITNENFTKLKRVDAKAPHKQYRVTNNKNGNNNKIYGLHSRIKSNDPSHYHKISTH